MNAMSSDSIAQRYPIQGPYKDVQKTTSGKVIPFEEIIPSLYKDKASCTCFATSHDRIHAWIIAIKERLDSEENANTEWKDNDNAKAEFVVKGDHPNNETDYRVIVYVTTGKILIQGRSFEKWCKDHFQSCKKRVDQLTREPPTPQKQEEEMSSSDDTVDKDIPCDGESNDTRSPQPSPQLVTTSNSEVSTDERVTNDVTSDTSAQTDHSPVNRDDGGIIEEPHDDGTAASNLQRTTIEGSLQRMELRLDTMETAIVKFTKTLADIITKQDRSADKYTVILEKLQAKPVSHNANNVQEEQLKKQLKESEKECEMLKKKMNALEQKHATETRILIEKHGKELTTMKRELEDVRKAKIMSDVQNDKLSNKIHMYEENKEQQGKVYEERLKEKDAMIENIQDRLSNTLYEKNGEPWQEVGNKKVTKDRTKVTLIHDSVCKLVDIGKLTARSDERGQKIYSPTIEEASQIIDKMNPCDVIALHVGTNNLKSQSVNRVYAEFDNLLHKATKKCERIVVSLPTPCGTKPLNDKVKAFKESVASQLRGYRNISLCFNNNLGIYGLPNDKFYADNIHLNEVGTRLLSGNLIRTIFGHRTNDQRGSQRHAPHTPLPSFTPVDTDTSRLEQTPAPKLSSQSQVNKDVRSDQNLASQLANAIIGVLRRETIA